MAEVPVCPGCFFPDSSHLPSCGMARQRRKAACFDWEEANPQCGVGWSLVRKNWFVYDKKDRKCVATGTTRLECVEKAMGIK